MPSTPPVCPKCRQPARRHCAFSDGDACDLVACVKCRGYGTKDGRLWVSRP